MIMAEGAVGGARGAWKSQLEPMWTVYGRAHCDRRHCLLKLFTSATTDTTNKGQ